MNKLFWRHDVHVFQDSDKVKDVLLLDLRGLNKRFVFFFANDQHFQTALCCFHLRG